MRAALVLAFLLLSGCAAPATTSPRAPPSTPPLSCVEPCKVRVGPSVAQAREPVVAIDPRDARHVLAASMSLDGATPLAGRQQLVVHESRDGGATWTSAPFSYGTAETYDATILFLPDGRALLGGLAVDGAYFLGGLAQGGSRVFAATSDGGPAFGAPVVVAQGDGAEAATLVGARTGAKLLALEKPAFALAPDGAILVAFGARVRDKPTDDERSVMLASASRDGGRSWRALAAPPAKRGAMSGVPAFLHEAWVVPFVEFESFEAVQRGEATCALDESRDAGASWDERPIGDCAWLPSLAANGSTLWVAYPERDERVVLRASGDAGRSWGDARPLDAPEAPGRTVPTLARAGDALVATFFHALPDGATSYRAVAIQRGSVSAPLVLDARIRDPPEALGEYFGLVATPQGALATWAGDGGDELAIEAARLVVTA